jgi:hypothetical protein
MSEIINSKRAAHVALSLSLLLGACSRDNGADVEPLQATTTMTYMLPELKPTTTTLALSTPESARQGVRDVVNVPFDAQNCAKFDKTTLAIGEAITIVDPAGDKSYLLENRGLAKTGGVFAMLEHKGQLNTTRRYFYDYDFGQKNLAYDDGSSAHVEVQQNATDIDSIDVSGWTCI